MTRDKVGTALNHMAAGWQLPVSQHLQRYGLGGVLLGGTLEMQLPAVDTGANQ